MAWVASVYGATVQQADATPGQDVWRVVELREREGPSVLLVTIQGEGGQVLQDVPVARHWPGAPSAPQGASRPKEQAIVGHSKDTGHAEFALGAGDYITGPGQGVTAVWVVDPAIKSDVVDKLGMIAGTNHKRLDVVFRRMKAGGPVTPQPPQNGLRAALLAEAERRMVLTINPQAALQKAMLAHGYLPTSPEFDITHAGVTYRAQRAEELRGEGVRVYSCRVGEWDKVSYVQY